MTARETVGYVLRRLWLWPLVLWLRPIALSKRLSAQPMAERISGVLGSAVWGAAAGALLWAVNGDADAVWVLALSFAFSFVGITIVFSLGSGYGPLVFAVVFAVPVAIAVPGAGAVAVASASAGAVTVASASAVAGAVPVAGALVGVFLTLISAAGIALGLWLSPEGLAFGVFGAMYLTLACLGWAISQEEKAAEDRFEQILVALWLIAVPVVGSAFLPETAAAGIAVWGLALGVALGAGALAGLFFAAVGVAARRAYRDQRFARDAQWTWLTLPWTIFLPLAAAARWLGPDVAGLDAKLDELGWYLMLAPVVLSGLPAWPIGAALAVLQFRWRGTDARFHTAVRLRRTIPFVWQSCAFPLPGIENWLVRLGRDQGAAVALSAIQEFQFDTLQFRAARRAARRLGSDPQTALAFCGTVAIRTNPATVRELSKISTAGLAVAALDRETLRTVLESTVAPTLRPEAAEADNKPILLDIGVRRQRIPFMLDRLPWRQRDEGPIPSVASGLADRPSLSQRIKFAQDLLKRLEPGSDVSAYARLLEVLDGFASATRVVNWSGSPPLVQDYDAGDWLAGGWRVIADIGKVLEGLEDEYRTASDAHARRRVLESRAYRIPRLLMDSWNHLPLYWISISIQLEYHLTGLLEAEARQVRDWLDLSVEPVTDSHCIGDQRLLLGIRNPSAEPARAVRVTLEPAAGIAWIHSGAALSLLEGGKSVELGFDFRAETAGPVRIAGLLNAEDLDGNPFELPFGFRIEIGTAGEPYQPPPYQPYVTGEGLGSDRTFVGRADLMDWLRGLWRQPDGKPAVVLVGQRRIGKSSLLNKVERDGLAGTGLLPITMNVQGVGSEFDFLDEAMRRMAGALGASVSPPALDRAEPYAAFKAFLADVRGELAGRRFLLMLDEADLMPERGLGDLLPGFLRALMQEPQYSVVVLFCGTTRLRAMARDYFSILFNTAQFRTVSYLTAAESAEVLTKPAGGVLEYDPAVLTGAYTLTRGQPLLLQLIGATLINAFSEQVRRGEPRSNYVGTLDFDRAVEQVVRLETNAAFENHWEDSDPATHRVLAALAWATDDLNRRQLDIDGIQAAMAETRLPLARPETFRILERLADDEVLERDGPTYRFWVPMYRRWVAWRWPTQRVRDEMGD